MRFVLAHNLRPFSCDSLPPDLGTSTLRCKEDHIRDVVRCCLAGLQSICTSFLLGRAGNKMISKGTKKSEMTESPYPDGTTRAFIDTVKAISRTIELESLVENILPCRPEQGVKTEQKPEHTNE